MEPIEPQIDNITEIATQPEILQVELIPEVPAPDATNIQVKPLILGGNPSTWSPYIHQTSPSITRVIEKVTIIEEAVEEPPRVVENACKAAKAL